MKTFLIAYAGTVLAFLLIDGLWLGLVARNLYSAQLGSLLRGSPMIAPAGAFYLFYTAGLVVLAVRPFDSDVTLGSVAIYGALVGFLAYGTYDMTNLSTLRDWPVLMSFVDLAWGTVLSAACAVVGFLFLRWFGG